MSWTKIFEFIKTGVCCFNEEENGWQINVISEKNTNEAYPKVVNRLIQSIFCKWGRVADSEVYISDHPLPRILFLVPCEIAAVPKQDPVSSRLYRLRAAMCHRPDGEGFPDRCFLSALGSF